jgi:mannose-1-phosphate guanylyltransferase
MKAVILIGGQGTRLRPLTCNIPKAVVPVLNKPFLEHLLLYLKRHSVDTVVLAMGYNPDPIKEAIGDGSRLGIQLTYVVEESPLGTAGAVKNAEQLLDDTFIVFNGDIITEIDLSDMIKWHKEIKPKVSIALTPVDNPTIYGVVETDEKNMVKRFVEKPSWDEVTTNMINAGIYVVEPDVLKLVPSSTHCMFERQLFPWLLDASEPILGYKSNAYWIDIGTLEKYLKVHHDLLQAQPGYGVRIEGESRIHPTVQIEGPVLVAEGCTIDRNSRIKGPAVLGPHCDISSNVVIDGSVLWRGAKIAEESVLKNCLIGAHSYVESHLDLEDCVLGDNVMVGPRSEPYRGVQVWPENCTEANNQSA